VDAQYLRLGLDAPSAGGLITYIYDIHVDSGAAGKTNEHAGAQKDAGLRGHSVTPERRRAEGYCGPRDRAEVSLGGCTCSISLTLIC
jgi:hypothetical protein